MSRRDRASEKKRDQKPGIPYLQIAHAGLDVLALGGVTFYFYSRTSNLQAQIDQLKVDLVTVAKYLSQMENTHVETINNGQDVIKKTKEGYEGVAARFGAMEQKLQQLEQTASNYTPLVEGLRQQLGQVTNALKQTMGQLNETTEVTNSLRQQFAAFKQQYTASAAIASPSQPAYGHIQSQPMPYAQPASQQAIPFGYPQQDPQQYMQQQYMQQPQPQQYRKPASTKRKPASAPPAPDPTQPGMSAVALAALQAARENAMQEDDEEDGTQ